jgi:hypothetical protein
MINHIWNNITYYFRCFKKNNQPEYIKCMYTSTYNDNSDSDKDDLDMELECGKIHTSQFPTYVFVMSRD